MTKIIDKLICDWKHKCSYYISNDCVDHQCKLCGACDRNILLEYHKQHNICFKCEGNGIFTTYNLVSLITRKCNNCNGTGKYYPIKEL